MFSSTHELGAQSHTHRMGPGNTVTHTEDTVGEGQSVHLSEAASWHPSPLPAFVFYCNPFPTLILTPN